MSEAPEQDWTGYEPTFAQQHRGFTVHDDASADWALRRLARHRAKCDEAVAYADSERCRLDAYERQAKAELQEAEDYFGRLLADYHSAELAENPRRKTVHLPHGKLTARKNPDRVVVEDADAFFASQAFDSVFVRRKPPEVALDEVKKRAKVDGEGRVVTTDGEVLPGLCWVEGEIRFKVETETPLTPPPGADTDPF